MFRWIAVAAFVVGLASPSAADDSCTADRKELMSILDQRGQLTDKWADSKDNSDCAAESHYAAHLSLTKRSVSVLSQLLGTGCATEEQLDRAQHTLARDQQDLKDAHEGCRTEQAEQAQPPANGPTTRPGQQADSARLHRDRTVAH